MSILGNFKILPKMLAAVVLMMGITALLSAVGTRAGNVLLDGTLAMRADAKLTLKAVRAGLNVMAMNRAEFVIALDPRPESVAEATRTIENELKLLRERLVQIEDTRYEEVKTLVPAVKEAMAEYERNYQRTLRLASEAMKAKSSDQVDALRQSVMKSQIAAEKLRSGVGAITERLDDRVDFDANSATEEHESTLRTVSTIGIVGGILSIAFSVVMGVFGIARPMGVLVGLLGRLANGEEIEISGIERKDEIGATARAVNAIKMMLIKKASSEAAAKAEQERAVTDRRKRDMHQLADHFEGAVGKIIQAVSSASTQMEASANSLTKTAEQTQELSTAVAAAAEEASANVNSVASASEEMACTVREISRQVQESARTAEQAVIQARSTNSRVSVLSDAAKQIGDVVDLITNIAEQTNLLALNATIEAARAGEAGRGFAVVASEVKSLALQTAKATGDIGQQITAIQTATEESVASIGEISITIGRISEIALAITSAMEEQGAVTQEISRNIQQASQGTKQVASDIANVQRGSIKTESASVQVASVAKSLSADSNELHSEVQKFLATVRAA